MNPSECIGCVFFYEEKDVNWKECRHPDYDQEEDVCPGRYDREDAKADAREMSDESRI